MKSRLWSAISAGIFSFLSSATPAALIDNGGGLIYDDVLDITWAQPDELRAYYGVDAWTAGLTLGGVSGWRLPFISVAAGAGPFLGTPVDCSTSTELACRDNEMGYMFYHNLGGTAGNSILTSGDPDLALFPTLESSAYWSGTEYQDDASWEYFFNFGDSDYQDNFAELYTWAVHAGNVGAVPVPAAVWLFGSGFLGLIGMARRKKAAKQ